MRFWIDGEIGSVRWSRLTTPWDIIAVSGFELCSLILPPSIMESASSAMDISPDPVSLRAAALSTLKLKRRKPVPDKATAMPSRSTLASDFQLDYGQEDVIVIDPQPPSSPKVSQNSTQKVPMTTRDIQM